MSEQEDASSQTIRITNKQVYELLIEVKTEVKLMNQKLDNEIKKIDDHEQRLRKIEETIWRSAWITSVITALVTALATAIVVNLLIGGQ